MKLSVVVPVHNEAEVLAAFLARLIPVLDSLDVQWELLFVEDSSTDGTWEMIKGAAAHDGRIRGLRLSRSFGHQGALTAGMWAASGDLVITMDGDLQHPPETIPLLLERELGGLRRRLCHAQRRRQRGTSRCVPSACVLLDAQSARTARPATWCRRLSLYVSSGGRRTRFDARAQPLPIRSCYSWALLVATSGRPQQGPPPGRAALATHGLDAACPMRSRCRPSRLPVLSPGFGR